MPRLRPFGLTDFLLLLAVLAVAGGVRVWYLLALADGGAAAGPLMVQDPAPLLALPSGTQMRGQAAPSELDGLVHNLTEHHWYGSLAPFAAAEERTAHASPGYPWMLALLGRYMPAEDVDPVMRWIQCALGIMTAGLYFLFARRAFDSRLVASLAGLLTAAHPFWVINTAAINDGTAAAFLLGLLLFVGTVAARSGGAAASLIFGLSAAGLALLRAALLPFSFVAMLWLLWRSRKVEKGWLCALLAFLGFANGLAPWCIRNFQAFGEPVPIVTSAYFHLWQGNNLHAGGGPMTERRMLESLAESRGVSTATLQSDLGNLPQPERYRRLSRDVVREIEARPGEALQRRLAAAEFFFLSESLARKEQVASLSTSADEEAPGWLTRGFPLVLTGSLVLMIVLGVAAWRWTYPWRSLAMPSSLALVWIPLPYILGHAAHLHGPRMPLDGILLTYAAYMLAYLWPASAKALIEGPKESD